MIAREPYLEYVMYSNVHTLIIYMALVALEHAIRLEIVYFVVCDVLNKSLYVSNP